MGLEREELRSRGALRWGDCSGLSPNPFTCLYTPALGAVLLCDVPPWLCEGERLPRVTSQQGCPKASMLESVAAGIPLLSPKEQARFGKRRHSTRWLWLPPHSVVTPLAPSLVQFRGKEG